MTGAITAAEARKLADESPQPDVAVWLEGTYKAIHSAAKRKAFRITHDPVISGVKPSDAEIDAIVNNLVGLGYNVFRNERNGQTYLVISW